jgi:sulfur carrier protein
MKITLNGEAAEIDEGTTIAALLASRELGAGGPVAVERNGEVVRRAEHESTTLAEGDHVEVVHFVGGG